MHTAHSEVKEAGDSDLEPLYREDHNRRTQERLSDPSPDEGETNRRGNVHDNGQRPFRVPSESITDVASMLGEYPAGSAPCPLCCVVVGRTSWR